MGSPLVRAGDLSERVPRESIGSPPEDDGYQASEGLCTVRNQHPPADQAKVRRSGRSFRRLERSGILEVSTASDPSAGYPPDHHDADPADVPGAGEGAAPDAIGHVGSWETVALAARLIDQADPEVGSAAAARALLADLIATELERSPVDRWYVTVAALMADLGPALFGTEDRRTAAPWAAVLDGEGPAQRSLSRVAATVLGAYPAESRVLNLADRIVDGLVLPPTTSTLPWRRNLEGILANSDVAEASAPEFTAARTVLDDDAITRLRAATVTDALAVVDRLGTLADGTTELHSARPRGLADVSTTAVAVLRRALDLDTVAVIQLDGDTATSLASWGDALPPAAVLTGLVAAAPAGGGQLVALSREGVGSVVAGALSTSGPSTGVLWVARRAPKPDFDRWERNLVTEAAATLSLVLDDSSERRRLELLAHTDALTGLGNRGALDDELRRIFAAPIVERTDTALIMCDVDGLKNVNDTRGHAAGDDMLRTVADLLVELTATAPAASLYRLGGDEFCVLLREGGLLEADALASDLAHRGADLDIGLSCGVSYGVRADNARALLDAADEAQYAVKRRRRAMSSPGLEVRAGVGRRARRDRE